MVSVGNRIQKVLEDANIKLGVVASDVLGVSGRKMISAMIEGHTDAAKLADMACRRMREKIPLLEKALEGKVTDHHRFMLKALMDQVTYLEQQIERFSQRIEEVISPFQEAITLLIPMPGFDRVSAQNVIAEIGPNMTPFPTHAHLSSWSKICPGNNESAGKRRSVTMVEGDPDSGLLGRLPYQSILLSDPVSQACRPTRQKTRSRSRGPLYSHRYLLHPQIENSLSRTRGQSL
jgi:transposase